MATSFSGGRSQCTWREPPTMGKQLVNFITCSLELSAPFFVIYKAVLMIGLYAASNITYRPVIEADDTGRCTLIIWPIFELQAASDKVYQLFAHGRWFSSGTLASSTTKTGRHDRAEILLKVALNTKTTQNHSFFPFLKNSKCAFCPFFIMLL
jgi:hypothetical protein